MQQQKGEKPEQSFKRLLYNHGLSENAAAELWKWYDTSKKGVASF